MSVEPMQFLAEAFAIAKAEGNLDIQTGGEKEALTLRLQFYNLIRKCRRLAKPGGPPVAPVVEQIVADAGLVMIALVIFPTTPYLRSVQVSNLPLNEINLLTRNSRLRGDCFVALLAPLATTSTYHCFTFPCPARL